MTFRNAVDQISLTLGSLRAAVDLVKEHRLWEGLRQYGWAVRALVAISILFGLYFIRQVSDWFQLLSAAEDTPMAFFSGMGTMVGNFATDGYESFTSGILKYVVIVLSEVIIFHFMQRSLEVLRQRPIRTNFKAFLHAQIRMIKVVFRVYILELLVTALVSAVFGMFGVWEGLEAVALFVLQCYFFGLVILDNFNEQFGMTIRESMLYSRQFMGVSLVLGLVLYLLMLVPLVGVVAGTIWVSVTGAIVMNELADINDGELVSSEG